MDSSKIVIVCALKEEFAAVEAGLGAGYRERFELIRAGVGPVSAARVAKELAARETPPELIVSTGFCGGLVDEMKVGDIVVGSEIVNVTIHKNAPLHSDPEHGLGFEMSRSNVRRIVGMTIDQEIFDALQRLGIRARKGRMASTGEAVSTIEQKRELGAHYGADAVDMESVAIATNLTLPAIFMRVVSDAVTDELPAEVGEFLTEAGNVRIGKIARFILKKPSNIKRLMELKKRSDIAAKSLTAAWRAAAPVLL